MSKTSIEWTDHSVNPLRAKLNGQGKGHYCEKLSPGCKNCYSSGFQPRLGMPQFQDQRGDDGIEHWLDVSKLEEVLRRRKPTKWFWCDMTDMFGDWVSFEHIAACFGVMAATPHHTHQVLTKRPQRVAEWLRWVVEQCAEHRGCERDTLHHALIHVLPDDGPNYRGRRWQPTFFDQYDVHAASPGTPGARWPLPNVWLGVSAEDQQRANERVPALLELPAAVRFISAEPLLGPLDLRTLPANYAGAKGDMLDGLSGCEWFDQDSPYGKPQPDDPPRAGARIDWVIAGSESGQRSRPMEEAWVRSLRDQCADAGVSFFYKQKLEGRKKVGLPLLDGRQWAEFPVCQRDMGPGSDYASEQAANG